MSRYCLIQPRPIKGVARVRFRSSEKIQFLPLRGWKNRCTASCKLVHVRVWVSWQLGFKRATKHAYACTYAVMMYTFWYIRVSIYSTIIMTVNEALFTFLQKNFISLIYQKCTRLVHVGFSERGIIIEWNGCGNPCTKRDIATT